MTYNILYNPKQSEMVADLVTIGVHATGRDDGYRRSTKGESGVESYCENLVTGTGRRSFLDI